MVANPPLVGRMHSKIQIYGFIIWIDHHVMVILLEVLEGLIIDPLRNQSANSVGLQIAHNLQTLFQMHPR